MLAELERSVRGHLLLGELVLRDDRLFKLGQGIIVEGSVRINHFALFCNPAIEAHNAKIAIRVRSCADLLKETITRNQEVKKNY